MSCLRNTSKCLRGMSFHHFTPWMVKVGRGCNTPYTISNIGHDLCILLRLGEFGRCPRVLCRGQSVLPYGMADEMKKCEVNFFCPK